LSAWYAVEPNSKPKIRRSVYRSAKSVSVEPACSKQPQNTAAAKKRIITTIIRRRSSPVVAPKR
jgi:hypothetical protein